MPVTVVTDDQSTVVPATVPTSEKAGKPVTEVPTPGAADGQLGTGSFANGIPWQLTPMLTTPVPNPFGADGKGSAVIPKTVVIYGRSTGNSGAFAVVHGVVSMSGSSTGSSGAFATFKVANPLNVAIDAGTSTHSSVNLTWINPTPPTTYEVWKSTDGSLTFSLLTTISGSLTSYSDTAGMSSGNTWSYKLRAVGLALYSNVAGPAVYTPFGGAVRVDWLQSGAFPYTSYVAAVDDDGSAPFVGGSYQAPVAGSRGAVLNTAVNDFNGLGGTVLERDLWISSGHFDVGGAYISQALNRFYWLRATGGLRGMGSVYGQGNANTFIHISCPISSWGPFFSGLMYTASGGTPCLFKNFKINTYFDGPDFFVSPINGADTFLMMNVIIDVLRCRDSGTGAVLKYGYTPGCLVEGASPYVFTGGNRDYAVYGSLVNCSILHEGRALNIDSTGEVSVYNSTTTRYADDHLYEDIYASNSSGPVSISIYNGTIDGGGFGTYGLATEQSNSTISIYDHSLVFNHNPAGGGFDIDNEQGTVNVSTTSSYTNAFGPVTPVSEPTYTVPVPVDPPYNPPIFLYS